MCGFAGVVDLRGQVSPDRLCQAAATMVEALVHRGPDGQGTWVGDGIAMAHRRLCILDLSEAAAQPMVSADARHVLAFNGEIYNYRHLRTRLAGQFEFRSSGDTEVLLAALSSWGVEGALSRVNGMFAFAYLDRQAGQLTLARDRLGEKPLYYSTVGSTVLFGSELRALRRHPLAPRELDPRAVATYLTRGFVVGERSAVRGILRLPAGTTMTIDVDRGAVGSPQTYWDLAQVAADGISARHGAPPDLPRLRELLEDSVRLRLEADVPVGAFLSGGVDSSLIAALLQRVAPGRIKTFTVAMDAASHDEADHAAAVAQHLGTDHVRIELGQVDVVKSAAEAGTMYDEPFGDPSAVPTALMTRAARTYVKVALSGDGGDELFGGYNRYVLGQQVWRRIHGLPLGMRRIVGRGLLMIPPASWDRMLSAASPIARRMPRNPGDKLHKLAGVMTAESIDDLYVELASVWREAPMHRPTVPDAFTGLGVAPDDLLDRMMLYDSLTTLPDDMLVKVDRASMAASMEVRVPLLDHRLAEFAWAMPSHAKVAGGVGKVALRQVLFDLIPQELIDRPKMGFDPPVAAWLCGPLKVWGEELLSTSDLGGGLLDHAALQRVWREHQRGRRNHDYRLWAALMLLTWDDTRD